VTDFLVKLLVLTQRYAIQSGEERITAASIRMVSDSKMKILAPALSALRSRDPKAMSRFEDLLPVDAQLAEMMTPDPGSSGARLKMLRTYSSGALASAANPETKPVVHAAVAVTEEHELLGISQSDDPLQSLREAGWINQDIFEFSPAYRKS